MRALCCSTAKDLDAHVELSATEDISAALDQGREQAEEACAMAVKGLQQAQKDLARARGPRRTTSLRTREEVQNLQQQLQHLVRAGPDCPCLHSTPAQLSTEDCLL